MKKFCTKCGHEFEAVGREVICPACKAQAAEEAKHAAVLRAKKASWAGESVPVRISGRASTIIRRYGAANDLPFAQALDDLLKSSDYFKGIGQAWQDVEPYKSRRRGDKHATEDAPQGKPQEQEGKQDAQEAPQAAKQAGKVTTSKQAAKKAASKATSKATSKPQEVKQAAKKGGKKA